jgi:hypothetical protein
MSSPEQYIRIGDIPEEQLVLERFPLTLTADRTLLETLLKSKDESQQFIETMGRRIGGEPNEEVDEGESGDSASDQDKA